MKESPENRKPKNDVLSGISPTDTARRNHPLQSENRRAETRSGKDGVGAGQHPRCQNGSLAAYITGRKKEPQNQWFERSFVRRCLLPKLRYAFVEKVESVFKHRFAAAIACTDHTMQDFRINGDTVVWKSGIPSNDGLTYAVISMPVDGPGPFSVEWRIGRPRNIVRIEPGPIPMAYHGSVLVNGHALGRSAERSGTFCDLDGVHRLITSAIEQGRLLTRVYYKPEHGEGAIQWLLPSQQAGSIFVIRSDSKTGNLFTATSLEPSMAEILRQTANPLTHKGVYQSRKGVEA